jgi:hypothetical protein
MSGIHLNSDRNFIGVGPNICSKASKTFTQDHVCATVKNTKRLGVSFHRHGGDRTFST